jgi:hypothetical protein
MKTFPTLSDPIVRREATMNAVIIEVDKDTGSRMVWIMCKDPEMSEILDRTAREMIPAMRAVI